MHKDEIYNNNNNNNNIIQKREKIIKGNSCASRVANTTERGPKHRNSRYLAKRHLHKHKHRVKKYEKKNKQNAKGKPP